MRVLGFSLIVLLTAAAASASDGAAIYESKCKVCHSVAGAAGPMAQMGGPLDGVGTKRDEAWMRSYLKDPKSVMPEAKMKPVALSDEDFEAIVAYMMSLH